MSSRRRDAGGALEEGLRRDRGVLVSSVGGGGRRGRWGVCAKWRLPSGSRAAQTPGIGHLAPASISVGNFGLRQRATGTPARAKCPFLTRSPRRFSGTP